MRRRLLLIGSCALLAGAVAAVIVLLLTSGPGAPAATGKPVVFRLQANGAHLALTNRPTIGKFGTAAAPTVGEILTASTGGWTNSPTSFTWQWLQCDSGGANCTIIAGAAGSCNAGSCSITYAIVTGDIGHTIRISVTASNAGGASIAATSGATGVVTSATGTVTFAGTFENPVSSGTPAPWTGGPQCANYGASTSTNHYPGDFFFDTGTHTSISPAGPDGTTFEQASSSLVPPGAGNDSARIVLPIPPAGHNLEFCTIHGLVTPFPGDLGTDNYYALMIWVPQGMQINSSTFTGLNTWEFHISSPPLWSAPIIWQLHTTGPSNTNGSGSSLVLALETGACNIAGTASPGCQYRSNAGTTPCNNHTDATLGPVTCLPGEFVIPPGQLQYGVWNEVVMHVHEASDTSGSIQTYYKTITDSTWTQSSNVTGIPTIQWDAALGLTCPSPPTVQQPCGYPVKEDLEQYGGLQSAAYSMNVDNQIVGTSLAAVEAQMPTQGVTPTPPVNTVAPTVSGTAQQGQLLTASPGTWTGVPSPTFGYQWQDCNSSGAACANIPGVQAQTQTYTLVSTDVGHTVRVVVTATNTAAPSGVTANSAVTAVVTAVLAGAGTGPSKAECRVGGVVTGALTSCTTPSTTTPTTVANVTMSQTPPGNNSQCTATTCPLSIWIPGNLVTNNPAKPVPLVVGYSDGSVAQDSEPDWVGISAKAVATNGSNIQEGGPFIYVGFPHLSAGTGGSYGAATVYGPGLGDQESEIADFVAYMKAHYSIDSSMIFASGGSKGGSMSNDTLCATGLAPLFAGVAPVSEIIQASGSAPPSNGSSPLSFAGSCPAIFTPGTTTPVSNPHPTMVQITNGWTDGAYGTACTTGGEKPNWCIMGGQGNSRWYYTPTEQATKLWGAGYGCSSTPLSTTTPVSGETVVTYGGCQGGVLVQKIILASGCHSYSCSTSGPAGFDVARSAWDFFTSGDRSPS